MTAGRSLAENSSPAFDRQDYRAREVMRDLHGVKPAIYWTDFLMSALTGWTGFAMAVKLHPFSFGMLFSAAVATAAFYRGLCFIHEISHQSKRALPGFEAAWNLLLGYPLLMPSFVYAGVHQSHHKLSTYGTSQDPEYLPFARNSAMTVLFALESFLIPAALMIRFLFLSIVGFVSPPFHRWLVVHFSSLTMNLAYRREDTPELIRTVRIRSGFILLLWLGFAALAWARILPWRFFAVWLGISAAISFINTLRTLGAHAYESAGDPMDREGQLRDSIDTPGALWTELWAPVGLRYHALHHYFPGIPYHNLGTAWRRLSAMLPADAVYHRVRSRGLARSLRALYSKGRRQKAR
jgi:fatty acid desaturase